ncbi:MAG: hypothetical protein HY000_32725 [Planctomycetes bacterium]|nr:hypothetical protein [Planctomycetota bacterium]
MNYFAHGRRFISDPYFLAGTAIPDWLNVVDRRVRVRSKHAALYSDDPDPQVRSIARGVVQHHRDDAWFHETMAFAQLCLDLTARVRDALPPDDGFRPSFLGHILVEILLDAVLIAEDPGRLDAYYQAMSRADPALVQTAVNRMSGGAVSRLELMISGFCRERFLSDYADDAKLWFRLNQVMRRVGLAPLPSEFCGLLREVRPLVASRRDELLSAPDRGDDANAPCNSQETRP